ncbi:MAG TPA: DUF2752 domain-containing protein [Gracilimonas sp.]|uniref:DUF2752 domain-containing protein n=1 Tax=Gracilimonas sp. TaxID=1974203 RepID=UPI002DA70850|nr:DUF2752 domain-containing protein [Gracilimonas sp.]
MKFIHKHLEWVVFSTGLILLGLMSPEYTGTSLCLFDLAGIDFCPGEGLGHSIAYTFRGDLSSAMNAHFAGPLAVLILSGRVFYLWHRIYNQSKTNEKES